MEAQVIKSFLPHLVTTISDCIYPVSDQCLAKGLISDSTYRTILQSTGTNDDKARNLLSSILVIIEADHADSSTCFEIFLSILNENLPPGSRGILSAMKKELNEISYKFKTIVPLGQRLGAVPSATELSSRCVTYQNSLVGRLEDSIRQHERACAEKRQLEEDLKSKSEEVEKLKHELKYQTPTSLIIATTESRISANEAEIMELKSRIEEVEFVIEDQGMKLKRSRNKMGMEMKALFEQLNEAVQDEIARVREGGRKREEEQASQLSQLAEEGEQYRMTLQKKEEEFRKMEEYKIYLEESIQKKELEHKKALKEEEEKHKTTLQQLEAKHQKALEGREAEIHERVQEKVQIREMKLQMELQDKDLRIKDLRLELKNSELDNDKKPKGAERSEQNKVVEDKDLEEYADKRKFKLHLPFSRKKGKDISTKDDYTPYGQLPLEAHSYEDRKQFKWRLPFSKKKGQDKCNGHNHIYEPLQLVNVVESHNRPAGGGLRLQLPPSKSTWSVVHDGDDMELVPSLNSTEVHVFINYGRKL